MYLILHIKRMLRVFNVRIFLFLLSLSSVELNEKKIKKGTKAEILHQIKLPLFKSFLLYGYVNSFFSIQTKFCFYENHHQIRKGVMRQLFNYSFKPYRFYLFCSCQLLGYIPAQKKMHLTFLKVMLFIYILLQ